jgi:hypothetical protein
MNDLIGSSNEVLSEAGRAILQALAGAIIPASDEHGVPGADDEAIFAELLASAGPTLKFIAEHLGILEELAGEHGFLGASAAERVALAEQFRAAQPEAAALIISLICQVYYRDPRVLESLGTPPRPPFPEGYAVDQGDWSLLDPVRERGPIYRPVS